MPASPYVLLLALALVAGGALLVIHTLRSRRRALAQRVAQVAVEPADDPLDIVKSRDSFFIADTRAGNRHDLHLLMFARICRRLGFDPADAARTLKLVQLTAGLCVAAVVYAAGQLMLPEKALTPALALASGLAGWFSPILALRHLLAERTRAVRHGFADALELLVVCAEAGLALEDALGRVTHELQSSQPALAEELAMTSADMRVLPDRNQAFNGLADRIGLPAIRNVVNTLSQTLRYGTPLAAALRVAAAELRSDSIVEMEERAGKLPALMSIPLMIFILPTILLIVSGPAVLRLLDIISAG